MSKVLLTGFSSFGVVVSNPSQRLVEYYSQNPPSSVTLDAVVLPVVWTELRRSLIDLITKASPDYVLMLGVAASRNYWSVETRAKNVAGNIPDALGTYPESSILDLHGNEIVNVTLPVDALITAISAAGLPAQSSNDAGSYLCNAALYRGLQIGRQMDIPTGFLHIPADQETYAQDNPELACFTFDQHMKALEASFEVLQ